MKLLNSVQSFNCEKCKQTIVKNAMERTCKLGGCYGTTKNMTSDCTDCKHWRSQPITYPSGKCSIDGTFTGLGFFCEMFKKKIK